MAKLSKDDAIIQALKIGVDFDKDFHAQSYGNELSELAKETGYRKSRSASGSLGRAFFEHLERIYDKNPSYYKDMANDKYSLGGGIAIGGILGGYLGYKIGRARPQKSGFETEKKIGRKIKQTAKEVRGKKKMANGGLVEGDIVRITDYSNENYDKYLDKDLVIESISEDSDGDLMFDLSDKKSGKDLPFSFYEDEIETFDKGGEVSELEYKSIYDILKEKIDDAVEELDNTYEQSYQAEGEEVEHKSRDGFIAFTDGGYEKHWFEYINILSGSGTSLPTKPLDDEMERQVEYAYKSAKEDFIENNKELVEEIGEDKVNYHDLYELDMGDKAEELSELERDMGDYDSIYMKIEGYYFSPNNDRGQDGKHTIALSGDVNLEAPYHRRGNLDDYKEIIFTFDSIDELNEKMDSNLELIVGWFNGENYDESTREMKVRKMEQGGSILADGRILLASNQGIGGNNDKTYQLIKDDRDSDGKPYFELIEMPTQVVVAKGEGGDFTQVKQMYDMFTGNYANGGYLEGKTYYIVNYYSSESDIPNGIALKNKSFDTKEDANTFLKSIENKGGRGFVTDFRKPTQDEISKLDRDRDENYMMAKGGGVENDYFEKKIDMYFSKHGIDTTTMSNEKKSELIRTTFEGYSPEEIAMELSGKNIDPQELTFAGGGEIGKPRLKRGDKVYIYGKTWFQRSYGNTYHVTKVYVNDKVIGISDQTYGYGEQYIQTGMDILWQNYLPPYKWNMNNSAWMLKNYGIKYEYEETEVSREKDLYHTNYDKGGEVKSYIIRGYDRDNKPDVFVRSAETRDEAEKKAIEYKKEKGIYKVVIEEEFAKGGNISFDISDLTRG